MVADPVADPTQDPVADPNAEPAPNGDDPNTPVVGDDPNAEPTGDDPAANGDDPNAEPPAKVDLTPQEDYEDLESRFSAARTDPEATELTQEEMTRLRGYRKQIEDNQAAVAQRAKDNAEADQRAAGLRTGLIEGVFDSFNEELTKARDEKRNIHPSLLKDSVEKVVDKHLEDLKPYAVRGETQALREWIAEQVGPEHADAYAGQHLGLVELIQSFGQVREAQGKLAGNGGSAEVTRLKTENARLQAEILKLTSGEAGKGLPSTKGGAGGKGLPLSKDSVGKKTAAEIAELMSTPEGYEELAEALKG